MFSRTPVRRILAVAGFVSVLASTATAHAEDGASSTVIGDPGVSGMPKDARVYRFVTDDDKRWDVVTDDDVVACTLPCTKWVEKSANVRLKADDGEVYALATKHENELPYGVLVADVDEDEPIARTAGLAIGIAGSVVAAGMIGVMIADAKSEGFDLPAEAYPPLLTFAAAAGVAATVGFVFAADADGGVRIVPAATGTVDQGRSPHVLVGPATVSTRFPF